MIATAGLMLLTLWAQEPQRTYHWRDAAGQTHITDSPPPPGATVLYAPAPTALEFKRAINLALIPQSASQGGNREVVLSPTQIKAWVDMDQYLADARAKKDHATLESVGRSLIHHCLWGNGLWAMPAMPVISVVLMVLLGWWLALGLRLHSKAPLVGGFLILGFAFGHLILNVFLYHPQAVRLQQNLELLEQHMGTGKPLRPERQAQLKEHFKALEQTANVTQPPWRFPAEVRSIQKAVAQVMVDP